MGGTDRTGRGGGRGDESSFTGRSDSFGLDLEPLDLPPGTDLGGVTIVRLLAEGGMGRVYEGRQHAPDRPVAVKVLRSGLESRRLVRRFEFEAHLLARLKHPHVAQVHTLGCRRVGRRDVPFFVLELVEDARPIDAFARGLDVRGRVSLLARFAAAVGHGHTLGVVHRDIKPGNLLVAGDGTPKVIDFGVAHAPAPDLADATRHTDAGEILGTLRYMAPEQVVADPAGATPGTDVYALGLVLHELLTGRLPYDVRGHALVVAARIIGEHEADVLRHVPRALAGAAGVDRPAAVRLATIVDKCLRKAPADRYPTAGALADDLGRWLAGEPVTASPPTLLDSMSRRLARHRPAATAAAIALVSAAVAAAGITQATRRARHHEARAALDRATAGRERARAESAGFSARLQQAAAARALGNLPLARRLVAEATATLPPAMAPPLELACLAAAVAAPPDAAITVLEGHTGRVTAIAAAAAVPVIVTGAEDGSALLWRRGDGPGWSMTGRLEGHRGGVWAAAFAPDGTRVATAAADRTVRVWDTATGAVTAVLAGHAGGVYGVAFAPDGRTLATGSADDTVRLWSVADGTVLTTLAGHTATVFGVAFAADGGLVASASGDGTVRLWDPRDGRPVAVLAGHERRVFSVAFSADGRTLVSASEDATCRIWSLSDAAPAVVLRHAERVNAAVFSADGGRVATASTDGVLRLWDPATAGLVASLRGHAAGIWSLAAVPGGPGRSFATGSADATARIWDDRADSEPRLRCGGPVLGVAVAPKGGLAAASLAGGEVILWDPATCRETRRLRAGRGRTSAVDFSRDGGMLAAAGGEGAVRIWQTADGSQRAALQGHRGRVYGVAFSPDGRFVASCGEDRTVRIARVPAAADAAAADARVLAHPRRVYGVAWSSAGDRLATACEDGVVRLWPAADERPPEELAGHSGAVNWVAFASDGSRLASCSSDGTIRLWDPADGRALATLTGPVGQVWEVAFAPDSSRIAAVGSDAKLHLFDAADGRPLIALDGHAERIWSVAFTADGRRLVTGSADGTARVWGLTAASVASRRREAGVAAGDH